MGLLIASLRRNDFGCFTHRGSFLVVLLLAHVRYNDSYKMWVVSNTFGAAPFILAVRLLSQWCALKLVYF
jgi:hypothetical protein